MEIAENILEMIAAAEDGKAALLKLAKRIRRKNRERAAAVILDIATENDCTFEDVIESLNKNVVREQLSISIHYSKHGCHPEGCKDCLIEALKEKNNEAS